MTCSPSRGFWVGAIGTCTPHTERLTAGTQILLYRTAVCISGKMSNSADVGSEMVLACMHRVADAAPQLAERNDQRANDETGHRLHVCITGVQVLL